MKIYFFLFLIFVVLCSTAAGGGPRWLTNFLGNKKPKEANVEANKVKQESPAVEPVQKPFLHCRCEEPKEEGFDGNGNIPAAESNQQHTPESCKCVEIRCKKESPEKLLREISLKQREEKAKQDSEGQRSKRWNRDDNYWDDLYDKMNTGDCG